VPDENVKEVREALARFLYASATEKGKVPGITLIYGDGAIDSENMGRYILEIRNG
jgi:hypothetical protein